MMTAIVTGRRTTMGRFWLLLVLIAVSLIVTTTVHAREISGPVTIECTGTVYASVDAAYSQDDADKGLSHRHGSCHGPVMQVPASDAAAVTPRRADQLHHVAPDGPSPSTLVDPALRPPAA